MSKIAEQRAFEAYPDYCSMDGGYVTQRNKRDNYIKGYQQAEKDLELTWEDIKLITDIVDSENLKPHLFDEIDYQEVLKRFKAQKGGRV